MDFAGRDIGKLRYPIGRPITAEERATHYKRTASGSAPPMDFLSVVKLNSTYMELVDRWYPITGFSVWFGLLVSFVGLLGVGVCISAFFVAPAGSDQSALWFGLFVVVPMLLGIVVAGVLIVRTESWRWTHYPMRLNRKTRQVHVFRQNGTVLTVPWDDLYVVRGEAKSPMAGTTYDLRAHVLDDDGKTVLESFTLGYSFPGTEASPDKFWAFLQPYMEAPDGVQRTHAHLKGGLLMPLDGRKEGWRWSIIRTFAPGLPYPWTMPLLCIPLGLNAAGRMFAMWTSRQPVWPPEIEQANQIDPDDPYVLTWRDNGPIGWWEFYLPLLCTVLGVGISVAVLGSMLAEFWK